MPVQAIPLFSDLSVFAEFHIPDLAPLDVHHLVVIHLLLLIGRQISIAVKTDSFMALLNRVITERRQIGRMRSSCVSKTWIAAWQRRKKRGILGRNKHKFQNMKSHVALTAYVVAMGASAWDDYKTADGEAAGWRWLWSPGDYLDSAADVSSDGSLNHSNADDGSAVIRPAFWLNLESDIF